MSTNKLYTIAQKDDVKRLYESYKKNEQKNLDKIKELEKEIQELKKETRNNKNELIQNIKRQDDFVELEKLMNKEEFSFKEMIEKIQMMLKINHKDELAKTIVHELLAEIIMDTDDVIKRSEMLQLLLKTKKEIDGEKVNQSIYTMLQESLKK